MLLRRLRRSVESTVLHTLHLAYRRRSGPGSVSLMWLRAAPLERAQLPQPGTPAWTTFLCEVLAEAFSIARQVNVSLRWGTVQGQGKTVTASIPSLDPPGSPLRHAHWHSRSSLHFVQDSSLKFDAFEQGLLRDHTRHEQEYIEALEHAECLETLVPGLADIWHLKYRTPMCTSNRDFVELVLMLPLPSAPLPFNVFHERETLHMLQETGSLPARCDKTARRSFMVVSLPIKHAESPGYVRGYYASVEGVREDVTMVRPGELGTQWMMSTQTEAGGLIPRWMQELAMPSQIKADVPAFLRWAQAQAKRT